MNLISFFSMIFITSLSGSLVFAFWKLLSIVLKRRGYLLTIRYCLWIVVFFFIVPIVFLQMAFKMNLFTDSINGTLFQRTPAIVQAMKYISALWLVGFIWKSIRYIFVWNGLRKTLKKGYAAQQEIQMQARELGTRFKKKKVEVYRVPELSVPAIAGIFKCRVLLPEKVYDSNELEMILSHELQHSHQKDLLLKWLCGWIIRVQWFNPLTKILLLTIDRWGDITCDLRICYGEGGYKRKDYYEMMINNMPGEELDIQAGMSLRRGSEEMKERMINVSKYNPKLKKKEAGSFLHGSSILYHFNGFSICSRRSS